MKWGQDRAKLSLRLTKLVANLVSGRLSKASAPQTLSSRGAGVGRSLRTTGLAWVVEPTERRPRSGGGSEPDGEVQERLVVAALRAVDRSLPREDRGDDLTGALDVHNAAPAALFASDAKCLLHEAVNLHGRDVVHAAGGEDHRLLHEPYHDLRCVATLGDGLSLAVLALGEHRLDFGDEAILPHDSEVDTPGPDLLLGPGAVVRLLLALRAGSDLVRELGGGTLTGSAAIGTVRSTLTPPAEDGEGEGAAADERDSSDEEAHDARARLGRPQLEHVGVHETRVVRVGHGREAADEHEARDEERGVDDDAVEKPEQEHGGSLLVGGTREVECRIRLGYSIKKMRIWQAKAKK